MTTRRVLFIAYNFPPHGGPGVQRSTKFVKYLPEFGWQPVVVTSTEDAGVTLDPSMVKEVPNQTPVYRAEAFSGGRMVAKAKKFRLGTPARVLNTLLALPDPALFWAQRARTQAVKAITEHQPNLLYSTSGPYSNHLLAAWIKKKYGLPWFADFRDPWSTNLVARYPPGYRALNRRMERRVLQLADRVACVSAPWLDELFQNLGNEREKFMVLSNGYDDEDIKPTPLPEQGDKFTILHTGTFYPNREPKAFIAAVRQLIKQGTIPMSQLRLIFIGENARNHVPSEPPFEVHDYMPHAELAQYREQAHSLLLILATEPENRGNYSGKIFEYIAANRPILGLAPPGGVAEALINESQTGITCDGSVEHIGSAIASQYSAWIQNFPDWAPKMDVVHRYTRRGLSQTLATTFDEMVK